MGILGNRPGWRRSHQLLAAQIHYAGEGAIALLGLPLALEAPEAPRKEVVRPALRQAHTAKLPVRLIIVSAKDPEKVDAGEDASGLQKTFDVREEFVGQVISFDDDAYVIDFRKRA